MVFAYKFLVLFIQSALPVLGIFIKKGKFKSFIEGQSLRVPKEKLVKKGKRYWFHCASLGEFEQARPIMEQIKQEDDSNSIVISFFSPSGYIQKSNYPLADFVFYLPLDTPKNAKNCVQDIQADVVIFVKYEIWYFHLSELFKQKTPVYLISAVFREKQFLMQFFGKWLFNLLPQFKQLFVQDLKSFNLLKSKGLNNVTWSGDTRFDRVKQNALSTKLNSNLEDFKKDSTLLAIGSSWQPEEIMAFDYLKSSESSSIKLLIAPHDIGESHIQELLQLFNEYKPIRYTQYKDEGESRVLILDTIGHLSSAYFYADSALIGGGFGKGLHNILEALAFGVPVYFGPKVQNYPEAQMAIDFEVARILNNSFDLIRAQKELLEHTDIEQVKLKCTDFIQVNSGASQKVLNAILSK
jgi:3-deoxy-D-manno-octulosonic-acid transferase